MSSQMLKLPTGGFEAILLVQRGGGGVRREGGTQMYKARALATVSGIEATTLEYQIDAPPHI